MASSIFFQSITNLGLVLGLWFMMSAHALAQSESEQSANNQANIENRGFSAKVSKIYDAEARAMIERHIGSESFQLFVRVEAQAPKMESIPLFPENISPTNIDTMPFEVLDTYVTSIDIKILLAERFGKATRDNIEEILKEKLSLKEARGDSIKFSVLKIEIAPPKDVLETAVNKLEADNRSLQERLESLNREREDARLNMVAELTAAKTEVERLKSSPAPANVENKEAKATDLAQNETAPLTPSDKAEGFWEKNGFFTVIGFIFVALLGLGVAFFTIKTGSAALSSAISSIGDGLTAVGQKIGDMSSFGSHAPAPELAANKVPELARHDMPSIPGNLPPLPIEAMQARIVSIHEEIISSLNEKTEFMIVQYVGQMLMQPELVNYAVATLEILGKENAYKLFNRMGSLQQKVIADAIGRSKPGPGKLQVMMEAAESLKTRLFGEMIGKSLSGIDDKVAGKASRMRDEDFIAIFKEIDIRLIPRLLHYMEPRRVANVLRELKNLDVTRLDAVSATIPELASTEESADIDTELMMVLEEYENRAKADHQARYLEHYRSILESCDDDLAERVMERIEQSDRRVGAYLREHIITFNTLWMLAKEIQMAIISSLHNRDIAALIANTGEEAKDRIYNLIDRQRSQIVEEEITRLRSHGQHHAAREGSRVKQVVVVQIQNQKGDRKLSELMEHTDVNGSFHGQAAA